MEFLSKQKLSLLRSLHRKKAREKEGLFFFEGLRTAEAAIASNANVLFWVLRESAWSKGTFRHLVKSITQSVFLVQDVVFDELSDVENDQGLLGIAEFTHVVPDELTHDKILVLDEIRDPGNAGTLIRTAAWFGIQAVLYGPGTVDPFSPKVVRASMGAIWGLDLARTKDLSDSLSSLQSRGYTICAAEMNGKNYREWKPVEKTGLVLGNEAHGISAALQQIVDQKLTIPGSGNPAAESLNAAIAGSILMSHWTGSEKT